MSRNEQVDCGCADDVAAYALRALEPLEAERFERHMNDCALCVRTLAGMQSGVDVLPREVPGMALPSELRGRIMQQVNAEAELLSAAGSGADRVARPRRSRPGLWARLGTRRFGISAGALAVACGVLVGVVVSSGGDTAPGGQTIHAIMANVPAGASAELVRNGPRAELVVSHLPQPPRGRIYQVWLSRGSGPPIPTDALFSVSRAGDGRTDVPGDLRGVRKVMVTAEPLGGSRRPTSQPIIIAST